MRGGIEDIFTHITEYTNGRGLATGGKRVEVPTAPVIFQLI